MEEMKKTSLIISKRLEESYSPEEILLRRYFLNYMHKMYTMAFTRPISPKMDVQISGSAMEGFNPLRLSAMLHENYQATSRKYPTASDVDIMCIFHQITAADTVKESEVPGVLRLSFKEDNPGYAQLIASEKDKDIMKDVFSFLGSISKYTDDNNVVDSGKFCATFYMYLETVGYANIYNHGESVARMMGGQKRPIGLPFCHGPAATNAILMLFGIASETNIVDYDLVPAIRVPTWPEVAEGWRRRLRQWPGSEIEKKTVASGCHVVPVGRSGGQGQEKEWRLSFSTAETLLIHSWNSTQQKTYILLKALCYQHLQQNKGLSTYHIKTAMFWACEREATSFWIEENLIGCVRQVLADLRECCKSQNLLHYFVTGNNLFVSIDTTLLCNAVANIDKLLYDGLSAAILACPYILGSQKNNEPLETEDSPTISPSNRLRALLQYNLKDWDLVCAEVVYGTKSQMYTGNEDKTIDNLKEELKKVELGTASTDNDGNDWGFMQLLYKHVILENLAWLMLGKAVWEPDQKKQAGLFRTTETMMKRSTESGSRSALAKYAYFLYKTGKHQKSKELCEYLIRTSDDSHADMTLFNVNQTNLVKTFEHLISKHLPKTDVVLKGEDHYALDEPLYSMVAAAPHFFSLQPRAFSYIVLALCYHSQGDHDGVKLTLKEYTWYAQSLSSPLLQGKELVTIAVLYHHFGYIPDAILHSELADKLDKRFSNVAGHIKSRNRSSLGSYVLGWVRGVVFSTFVAHTVHYIGAECMLEWADKYI